MGTQAARSQELSGHLRDEKLLRELLRADHNCLRGGNRTQSNGKGCVCKDGPEPRPTNPAPRSRSVSVTCTVPVEQPGCRTGAQFAQQPEVSYASRSAENVERRSTALFRSRHCFGPLPLSGEATMNPCRSCRAIRPASRPRRCIDQLPSCSRFAFSTSSCTASTASSSSEKPQASTTTRTLSR